MHGANPRRSVAPRVHRTGVFVGRTATKSHMRGKAFSRSPGAHARPTGQASDGGAAKQWPTGRRPASSHRHPPGCRCCSGGRSPAPQAAGAGNREASGNALTAVGAASSEAGRPGFPRVEVPAERGLEGVGRRYSWGTGWRPDAPRERPVVQIGKSERCPVAAGQPVRSPCSPPVAQQIEQAVHR